MHLDAKKVERQKQLMKEKEQKEMGNCTFAPKLNKKTNIRKPEASILVQNYYTTVVSARRGKRPTLINKDLLTQELMKQEKDKRDAEKKAKALNKKSLSKSKKRDDSKSVSDFNEEDDDEEDEVKEGNVTSALGTRLKVAFANKEPAKKKKKVKKSVKKEDDKHHCRHEDESKLLVR